jgi:hypothetical protein
MITMLGRCHEGVEETPSIVFQELGYLLKKEGTSALEASWMGADVLDALTGVLLLASSAWLAST